MRVCPAQRERYRRAAAVTVAASLAATSLASCSSTTGPSQSGNEFTYVTPEEVGWDSELLQEAVDYAESIGYTALMMLHDGKVFLEWGQVESKYQCHSIRKPLLSALIGIAAEEGAVDLDDTLADLGIDDIPPSLTAEELTATVRMLLMGRSGVYHEAAGETQEMIDTRPERGSHDPGAFFYYNNFDFNALGTIYRQETGNDIFEAFDQRIAGPIGMEDFEAALCWYDYEPEKSAHPVYKFRMSARDMARFGVLYEQNGRWRGEQLIPANWVEVSTMAYSVADSASGTGYGYMWGVFPEGSLIEELIGHPGFYHTGVGVHSLVVIPGLELVVVQRMDTDDPGWSDPGDQATFELIQMLFAAYAGG